MISRIRPFAVFAGCLLAAGLDGAVTAPPPGVVVAKSPDPAHNFIGSPSLVILPDGTYVASHDFFGKKDDPEAKGLLHSTEILQSCDRGKTWKKLALLKGQFWSSLFYHDNAIWLLGTNREYGEIVIRKSTDGGKTWTTPADGRTGMLTPENGEQFHCAPTPVVVHNGRIWRAFEDYVGGPEQKWSGDYFGARVLSAPADADLLDAKSWTLSKRVAFDPQWLPGPRNGWLEGNVVPTPDGRLVEIMRVNDDPPTPSAEDFPHTGAAGGIPRFETAALLEVKDANTLAFNPQDGFVHFPGGVTKFTIRYDPVSKRYWSLVNKITHAAPGYDKNSHPAMQRNVIELVSSDDLRHWTERCVVLSWGAGRVLTRKDKFGFQYLDWQFDGDDIVAVSRTAWDAYNIHNANLVTFHRVKNFRALTPSDAARDLAPR